MNRRGFLAGILASGVAPFVITTPGLLMPVKKVFTYSAFDDYGNTWMPSDASFMDINREAVSWWESKPPELLDLSDLPSIISQIYRDSPLMRSLRNNELNKRFNELADSMTRQKLWG